MSLNILTDEDEKPWLNLHCNSLTTIVPTLQQVVYPFTIPVTPTSLNLLPIATDVIITRYAPGILLFGFKRIAIFNPDQRPGGGVIEFQFPPTSPFYNEWFNTSFQSASIYASTRITIGGEFQMAHTGSGFFGMYNLGLSGLIIPNSPVLTEWIFTSVFLIAVS